MSPCNKVCYGLNSIGMGSPCIYHLLPTGPPEPPVHCGTNNVTYSTVKVIILNFGYHCLERVDRLNSLLYSYLKMTILQKKHSDQLHFKDVKKVLEVVYKMRSPCALKLHICKYSAGVFYKL